MLQMFPKQNISTMDTFIHDIDNIHAFVYRHVGCKHYGMSRGTFKESKHPVFQLPM